MVWNSYQILMTLLIQSLNNMPVEYSESWLPAINDVLISSWGSRHSQICSECKSQHFTLTWVCKLMVEFEWRQLMKAVEPERWEWIQRINSAHVSTSNYPCDLPGPTKATLRVNRQHPDSWSVSLLHRHKYKTTYIVNGEEKETQV